MAILLATYNGEEYLQPLLQSLVSQSYMNVRIYIRDDGSSDRSVDIVNRFVCERVVLVKDGLGQLGATSSFLRLLSVARADIYMFCDQDDIWLPEKVSNAVKYIQEYGYSTPLLFHTDLIVVDQGLKVVSDSFFRHDGLALPAAHRFVHLVVQNGILGCTMAVTEALVKSSALRDRVPKGVAGHDWWFALCASCFGRIVYSMHPDILYRQHRNNVSGVRRKGLFRKVRLQFSMKGIKRINAYKGKVASQAIAFVELYGSRLSKGSVDDLRSVGKLADGSGLVGVLLCLRRGIRLQNTYMNLSIFYSSLVSFLLNIKGQAR